MKLDFMGTSYEIRFVRGTYQNNGNLYLGIEDLDAEEVWNNFCDITVNFPEKCSEGCGFLKVSDLSKEVYVLIRPYISETGRVMENGYTKYPEVRFSPELLAMATELQ